MNLIDALSSGAADGLKLALNIGGMLIAFIAIIFALNGFLQGWVGEFTGLNAWVVKSTNGQFDGFSLQYILGQVFRVFAWLIGVDWNETLQVGSLLGQKTVINEFIAYENLAEMKKNNMLSNRAIAISTYALCGFAISAQLPFKLAALAVWLLVNKATYLN